MPLLWLVVALAAGLSSACEACAEPSSTPAVAPSPSATGSGAAPSPSATPSTAAPAHDGYLILASRSYHGALAPLVDHRKKQGHQVHLLAVEDIYARLGGGEPDAHALRVAIRETWEKSGRTLGFVLLVGDVRRPDEPSVERLPTFYLPKVVYQTHDHNNVHYRHRSLLHPPHSHDHSFPSDHPYALMTAAVTSSWKGPRPSPDPDGHERHHDTVDLGARADLAVGRLPARSVEEVEAFVAKVIAYESGPVTGDWSRRLVVFAGPARFSRFVDKMIESSAFTMLDRTVSYDFDLRLVFAKPGSAYTYRLDQLGDKLVQEANHGALMLLYAGHSSPAYLDSVPYRGDSYLIGSRNDFLRMQVVGGPPVFVALSCGAGGFDMSKGRQSMAEAAVMNPRGPIGAFAATRESHPYPNMLYAEAIIAQFLSARPRTLGEGIVAAKADMQGRSSLIGEQLSVVDGAVLKQEHAALYMLFGDPATRLQYPAAATVTVDGSGASGSKLTVTVNSPSVETGRVTITLEIRRTEMLGTQVPAHVLDQLPLDQAFERMADNHERAVDKVLHEATGDLRAGSATITVDARDKPGAYVVKALVEGTAKGGGRHIVAVGHTTFEVPVGDGTGAP
ncbi:MAG: hypothetical protein JRI68_25620 [Deltaproteobacteria bacterium]|nr:hypothetical protein [Deltaproteobacteria bacterium]